MEKPRVLILVNGCSVGLPFGGAERFGLELALSLDRQRCEAEVLALFRLRSEAESYWVDRLASRGVPCWFATDCGPNEDCRPGEFGPRYLRALRGMPSALAGRRYDIVHSNSQLGSVATLLLRRQLGSPVLLRTAHLPKEWGKNTLARWIFSDIIYPLCFDATAGVSREICERLDRRLGALIRRRPLHYIPNAMDFDRFAMASVDRSALLRELGLPETARVVGSVGRLTAQKAYDQLLDAAAIFLPRLPDVHVLLVGDGELRPALEAQAAALGITDRVHFAGVRPDVERLLRAMDVFVSTSLWEGLPTVLMEAMAAGVPVAATDIPGSRDLVVEGETGWLAPVADPAAMAGVVERMLAQPGEAAAAAARAREQVRCRYSMAAVAESYLDLYGELIRRYRGVERHR